MKRYDKEFKAKIIKEVIETNNRILISQRYGLSAKTVYGWLKKEKDKEHAEDIKKTKIFKKQIEELQIENEILKELLKKTYQIWRTE